jgi:hypothetical protein
MSEERKEGRATWLGGPDCTIEQPCERCRHFILQTQEDGAFVRCPVCEGAGAVRDGDDEEDNCGNGCKSIYVIPAARNDAPAPQQTQEEKCRECGKARGGVCGACHCTEVRR